MAKVVKIKPEKPNTPAKTFKKLKDIAKDNTVQVDDSVDKIPNYIAQCRALGQDGLANKFEGMLNVMSRERNLLRHQMGTYVYLEDIAKLIENIENQVVKFCELENFPRVIPQQVVEKIKLCKENKLFDRYHVLFVDYTETEYLSKEKKIERKKNRDPILFGCFEDQKEKQFLIADWIDPYCDLTFDKMVDVLKKNDKGYKPEKVYENLEDYLNQKAKEDLSNKGDLEKIIDQPTEDAAQQENPQPEQKCGLLKRLLKKVFSNEHRD